MIDLAIRSEWKGREGERKRKREASFISGRSRVVQIAGKLKGGRKGARVSEARKGEDRGKEKVGRASRVKSTRDLVDDAAGIRRITALPFHV